jgi:hypothetical protein
MIPVLNRRGCLAALPLGAAAIAPGVARAAEGTALSSRAHFQAQPQFRTALVDCFTKVLGCPPPRSFSMPGDATGPASILAFRFAGGGAVSVEFTPDALDEAQARHGAWLEILTPDPPALRRAILEAGLPQVEYAATRSFYFAAPGGQVFGVPAGPGAA